ncbi:MAG: HAD family hydrolase [Acidimicrobiales bacterium]
MPGHSASIESIRPHLRDGFPWHRAEQPHLELNEAEEWWRQVGLVFARAFRSLGLADDRVPDALAALRTRYCDASHFQLFPDTVPALRRLRAGGWRTVVLSNHVPELRSIVEGLDLGPLIHETLSSASTGYEKPHPEAFRLGLSGIDPANAWMVGDNPVADARPFHSRCAWVVTCGFTSGLAFAVVGLVVVMGAR